MMRWLLAVTMVVGTTVRAEDEAQRRAREELERQLNQMVEKAPSRVRVEFQPLEDPNLQVEELTILLDNKPLKVPTAAQVQGWVQDGPMPVAVLDVSPERHLVTARITVHNGASPLVVDDGDVRWRVSGDVRFDVAPGLEVRVIVTPVRDGKQPDPTKRLKLTFPSSPTMISKLEDGVMPEAPKPRPVVVAVVDAGPSKEQLLADAAAVKKQAEEAQRQAALEAKRLAEEEKKRKAAEALEAKRLAAEEKKRKADEALEAGRASAEEKKRKAEEALEAKRLAAEEKKRGAEEAKVATRVPAEEKPRRADEAARLAEEERTRKVDEALAAKTPVEAPADVQPPPPVADVEPVKPAAEVLDASVVVAQAPSPTPSPTAAAPAATGGDGPPWLLIGGGVGVALLAVVIVLARRAGRVPQLKE
ncbi:MAG: hypothetical protein SFW67_10355 [Myxococcaceae bacterium]|nr:hypothetical protein [Myxococcaceae bacterium]